MSLANRTRAQRLGRSRFMTLLHQLSQQIDDVHAKREHDLDARFAISREAERTGLKDKTVESALLDSSLERSS